MRTFLILFCINFGFFILLSINDHFEFFYGIKKDCQSARYGFATLSICLISVILTNWNDRVFMNSELYIKSVDYFGFITCVGVLYVISLALQSFLRSSEEKK